MARTDIEYDKDGNPLPPHATRRRPVAVTKSPPKKAVVKPPEEKVVPARKPSRTPTPTHTRHQQTMDEKVEEMGKTLDEIKEILKGNKVAGR